MRKRGALLLAAIPLTAMTVLLLVWAVDERQAATRLRGEIDRIQAAGQPLGNGSLNTWLARTASSQGSRAWAEVIGLGDPEFLNLVDLDRLPVIGYATLPAEIDSEADWEQEADVAEALRWMGPVIERIDEATDYPTPVWQPIDFRGYDTLLPEVQSARGINRLLQLEVEHSLYHRDAERALRGLESMRVAADAFDWQIWIVVDLVRSALVRVHQAMIRRSLSIDLWDEQQLQALAAQVAGAPDIGPRWRNVIAGERAMMFQTISDGDSMARAFGDTRQPAVAPLLKAIVALPSVREAILGDYREVISLGDDGIDHLTSRAAAWQERLQTKLGQRKLAPANVLRGLILPGFEPYAISLRRLEDDRRLTRVALAIKRFQLRHGEWPADLSRLSDIGLTPSDWSTVEGENFGFEATADVAYVWGHDLSEVGTIPATRPRIDKDPDAAFQQFAKIR